MECFTSHSTRAFSKVQNITTPLSQKAAELYFLVSSNSEEIGATEPLMDQAVSPPDVSEHVVCEQPAITLHMVRDFVLGFASWIDSIMAAEPEENTVNEWLLYIVMAFIEACVRITKIVVQRNEYHSARDGPSLLLPVQPDVVMKVSTADFPCSAGHEATRLKTFYDSQKIDNVTGQKKKLLCVFRNERVLFVALERCEENMYFEALWVL